MVVISKCELHFFKEKCTNMSSFIKINRHYNIYFYAFKHELYLTHAQTDLKIKSRFCKFYTGMAVKQNIKHEKVNSF